MRLASLLLLMFVVACGAAPVAEAPPAPTEAVAVPTLRPTDTTIPTATLAPTDTALPTKTPQPTEPPTETAAPTNTAEPTATSEPDPNSLFALNNLAVKESGGVRFEVARISIGRKDALPDIDFKKIEAFKDIDVVGEIVWRITNTSDQKRTVYANQGTVVIGNEQIALDKWMFGSSFGDSGNEMFPGVTQVGGVWFGIQRSDVPDITKMIYNVGAPMTEAFSKAGDDFYFEIDLSKHEHQPLPDDLK